MKKTGVLNIQLSQLIASLGHGDMLVIGDAGLPIPKDVVCIDLAVSLGIPSLQQVLNTILQEVYLEQITLANQTEQYSPSLWFQSHEQVAKHKLQMNIVSHEEFKEKSKQARAIVRTGDITPYTNIILHSGVPF